MLIEDGEGQGYKAGVDKNHRIQALCVSLDAGQEGATNGDTYNVNTGTISLTSANESALMYLKNNGTKDVHVTTIGYLIGNSTGGSGDLNLDVIRNPTAGTLVSGASAVDVNINKNFGSTNTLTVDAFKGAEGNTLTDGDVAYYSLQPNSGRAYLITTGTLVLPQGSSIGVNVTPQTGNTAMDIQVFLAITEYDL